ncbi:hypothetical protein V5O48_004782 [Marasmius crinis-equi]|uniref:FAD-binding PCMH-type domain-containing protein n=1 Tax=Marasmius crinis-equi TaxID=585013 RepID=A0ABR3FP76_9AGAR
MAIKLRLWVLFVSTLILGSVADIVADLNAAGIMSYGPSSEVYQAASIPCKACRSGSLESAPTWNADVLYLPDNMRYAFKPAVIAFAKDTTEVSTTVKTSVANGLKVVARSGGHSYIANGLGGKDGHVVIDLSQMKTITYDPTSQKAIIGSGNRLGDIALGLDRHGRGIPHGTCPHVGIGGHTAFGGFGHASRMWGLALDAINGFTAVLANGTVVQASRSLNSELFWAMRGAGPSFGITTSIEFNTHPVPTESYVYHINWQMTATQVAIAIKNLQVFSQSPIPAELSAYIYLAKGNATGMVYVELTGGWYGSQEEFDRVIEPYLMTLPEPAFKGLNGNGTYIDALQSNADGGTLDTSTQSSKTFYAKSLMVPESEPLESAALDALGSHLAYAGSKTSNDTYWFVMFELFGGTNSKINSVPVDDSAFARRDTLFTIQLYMNTVDSTTVFPTSGYMFLDGAVDSMVSNMPPSWNYGAYLNYPDDRLQIEKQHKLYFGDHYSRLHALKTRVDPDNVFGFPTSVNGE